MVRVILLMLLANVCHAETIAVSSFDGVVVSLTDEACSLPAVRNAPLRATWEERGVTTQGCYGVINASQDYTSGAVVFYFDDKSVVSMPGRLFVRVRQL